MRIYYESDADFSVIKNKKLAVIGYGNQGAAHANNLKDSGVSEILIGLKENSPSRSKAQEAGFNIATPVEAASWADIVMILTPDEGHGQLYKEIEPYLRQGAALAFAHGLAVHFGLIEPRADLDVFLLAPKGPGHAVRSAFQRGGGIACLLAIAQDATGCARDIALSYACANGAGRAGIIETSFREEVETDLFGEQAVLCGGAMALARAAFETLVEAGYAPEMAYLECLHELKLVVDLLYKGGMSYVSGAISNTAEYGAYVAGPRLVTSETKAEMKRLLTEIQDGTFVRNFMLENQSGLVGMKARRRQDREHALEVVGAKLRNLMPLMIQDDKK